MFFHNCGNCFKGGSRLINACAYGTHRVKIYLCGRYDFHRLRGAKRKFFVVYHSSFFTFNFSPFTQFAIRV